MKYLTKWILKYYYKLKVSLHPKTSGVMDIPDPRDYIASSPFIKRRLPRKVDLLAEAEKIGFKRVKQSKNACTAYSVINGASITNTIETGVAVNLNSEEQWAQQILTGGGKDGGDTLQNANKQFSKNPQGYPETEYRKIDYPSLSEEEVLERAKRWLALKFTIRTGCLWRTVVLPNGRKTSNYSIMRKTGTFVRGEGKVFGGHAWELVGYDDNKDYGDDDPGAIQIYESELDEWGDEIGVLWIRYKDLPDLMSLYISLDAKST